MAQSTFSPESVANHIVTWLKAYLEASGMDGWVVGVSGGVDSAVTSTLCAMTGAPTTCVEMPIHQAPDQVSRAGDHIASLCSRFPRVRRSTVSLTEVYDAFSAALPDGPDTSGGLAMANSRARLRMTTLYALGQRSKSLVAGTGNKVEDFGVGFYTKYGDGGVDLSPIADLTKTEVFSLAAHLGVIAAIQQAAPTDGLWGDDRTDEDQLGATYPELEWAMVWEESNLGNTVASREAKEEALPWRQREVLSIYRRHHQANRHKMIPIPVCEVPDSVRYA
ncbi:MAG: NAD(+) synthase [Flavobacteriales bacterium]